MLGTFEIAARDGAARTGKFLTHHGWFETPAFMPVGTQGTVKGVTPAALKDLGAQIVLSNTYHLHLRPGDELIRDLGGLHSFMGWDGPILTDSGGYQVFSLSKLRKIDNDGVNFQSHVDGSPLRFTPEKVIGIEENLGVDIMMVLDECLPYPSTKEQAEKSLELTLRWAKRSQEARNRPESLAFGIVQGGMFPELRTIAAAETVKLGFNGYAIGGLSVGEPPELMYELVRHTAPLLPESQVRYLMGVGYARDIVTAVAAGVDMFDCVIPTRSARFGRLFVGNSSINLRNSIFRTDKNPIEIGCECYTCTNFSKAYLSHLFHAKEVLAVTLASIHNLFYYQRLMRDIRAAIRGRELSKLLDYYCSGTSPVENERELSRS